MIYGMFNTVSSYISKPTLSGYEGILNLKETIFYAFLYSRIKFYYQVEIHLYWIMKGFVDDFDDD